jgi:ABC-type lipoprotein export system ATPase subunit
MKETGMMEQWSNGMLNFQNVTKVFNGPQGKVTALNSVSFSVEPGEVVAIRGPSGCGKSTLLLTAGTLLRPTQGSVAIDGRDPYALAPNVRSTLRAETIGFVFQQFHLVPYLSVLDNVRLPSVIKKEEGAQERAQELLARFGLEHRAQHVPAQLSIGERQRTALARALFNRPQLLLADEPTGNLDPENGEIVLHALKTFAEGGGAVLLVTHDIAAADCSTRTLQMLNGSLF